MVASANQDNELKTEVRQLELDDGMLVQELGWDDDCEAALSEAVEDVIGSDLLEEDTDEVVDAVLLWWRSTDGDLVDTLMDAVTVLADDGYVWVFTPKTGLPGHVEPAIVNEAAQTVGMAQTKIGTLGEWAGSRLAQRKKA